MIKFQRFFFIVLVSFILIFHFEVICINQSKINKIGNVSSHSDLPHPNDFSWGGDVVIEYNKFYAPHGIEDSEVYWEFSSTGWYIPSAKIDITVLIMSNTTFLNFNNSVNNIGLDNAVKNVPFNNTIISEGKFSDSGYSSVPHRTVWYVIFANLDEDKLRSHLIFYTFFECFRMFLHVFAIFTHFLTIFHTFLLAYFTQTLQPNPSNPIFTRKTNITPEEINRKSLIFPKSG